jgi:2-polyprenyl-3-methyl-5-hydroxy-6-metoxy-1,4-benzoquinol methylase
VRPADAPSAQEAPPTLWDCPACGASDGPTLASYRYEWIWERYRETLGFSFSDGVVDSQTPAEDTRLVECAQCRLQYFSPSRPGGAQFYSELMANIPYLRERWEFGLVARRARGAISLVDLGCGDGAFLRIFRKESPDTVLVGVDHNLAGLEQLTASGIEAWSMDFVEAAQRHPQAFEVVCLFQTLEHVVDPLSILGAAAKLLRRDGRLFVTVPNRERLINPPSDPLDFPPHHVTRWQAAQLHDLAARLDLHPTLTMCEPPRRWDAGEPRRRRVRPRLDRLGPVVGPLADRLNNRLQAPTLWHQMRIKRNSYARRRIYGHTVLVELMQNA